MPDKRYPTLQQLAADHDWWLRVAARIIENWPNGFARSLATAVCQIRSGNYSRWRNSTSAGPIIWNAAREAYPPNEDSATPRRLGRRRLILESYNTSIRNTPGLSPGPLLRGRGTSNFGVSPLRKFWEILRGPPSQFSRFCDPASQQFRRIHRARERSTCDARDPGETRGGLQRTPPGRARGRSPARGQTTTAAPSISFRGGSPFGEIARA
jgi:hypothetical protein